MGEVSMYLPGHPGKDVPFSTQIEEKDAGPFQKCSLYRGTSLVRNCAPLAPYSRTLHRALCWPYGGCCFL